MALAEPAARIPKLEREQLAHFDTEYVWEEDWRVLKPLFDEQLGDRSFSFLDIGGGNGSFADRLLREYPNARGVVLDNAQELLDRNTPDSRKQLVCASVEDLSDALQGRTFEVIALHWVLHHFVTSSHRKTLELQRRVLRQVRGLVKSGGFVTLFENAYDGVIFDRLPGQLVYWLTASRLLKPLISRLGANTAGTGVCFRSSQEWTQECTGAGFKVLSYNAFAPKGIKPLHKVLLHIRSARNAHYLLKHAPGASSID
jgi:2-polyprenyl-3-methyl-5-hydroxy-6-metoxy-1,4-benzoquinol methylase